MEKGKFRFLPIWFRKIPNIFGIFPNTKSVSDSIPFIGQSLQPKSEYEMIPFLAKIRLLNKLIFRCRQRKLLHGIYQATRCYGFQDNPEFTRGDHHTCLKLSTVVPGLLGILKYGCIKTWLIANVGQYCYLNSYQQCLDLLHITRSQCSVSF